MTNESRYKSIEELQKKRNVFVAEAKEQGMFEGIKSTLTKLYTSSGHFIFELLQNAEDAKATSVSFKLYPDKLVFEHNGTKLFNLNDIDSITNYGDSTKKENGNSIGKFGIGFKSVFEYTNSPEIHSGDYNFAIEDLFIPKVISPLINYDKNSTLISIPFNCSKDIKKCYSEIKKSIEELKADVLLFLQNIAEINCIIDSRRIIIKRTDSFNEDNCPGNVCKLSRKAKDGNVVVVDNKAPKGQSIYKRFFKKVRILDDDKNEKEITICIAFLMDFSKDDNKWKIKPIFREGTDIPDGRIFAYFPCDAEERRFCFHIHAPFALKPDREKLRDEDANKNVIEELGTLLCESMKELKQDGLVDLELYKTLPNLNDDDNLGWFEIIRSKIINFYLNNPYILMSDGTYQDGRNKFIGFHNIQKLLSNEDLSILYDSPKQSYWVKNPMQNRRDYNFLISLQIREFTIVDFLKTMIDIKNGPEEINSEIIKLFESRDSEWFVRLYSLMNIGWNAILRNQIQSIIPSLQLCYCDDKKLYKFNNCYLNDSISDMESSDIHCVNSECLNSKQTDTDLLYFLKNRLGLREYNISDMIEILCEDFEKKPNKTLADTMAFYKMYLKDDSIVDVLSKHKILCSDDGIWDTPDWFYIPEEYGNTYSNLSIYFDFHNAKVNAQESNSVSMFYYSRKPKEHSFYKLNPEYKKLFKNEKEIFDFIVFLKRLDIQTSITVWNSSCRKNPIWNQIQASSEQFFGGNAYPTDYDYEVKYFDSFLKRPMNEAVFELVWTFLQMTSLNFRSCRYSPAQKYPVKIYPSHITMDLRNNAWVMQIWNGKTYFVKPEDALKTRLPSSYQKQIENSQIRDWLISIEFGKNERKQNEQQKKENEILASIGLDIGFVDIIRDLQNNGVSKIELEEYMQALKEDLQSKIADGFFSNDTIDEERLISKSINNYNSAEDINFEQRTRSVRIGTGQKELAERFLRGNCIDSDNVLHCQLCKNPMPFKDKNNEDYFEIVQLFHKELIKKDVKENYIALCPVCSAKMKVYYQHDKNKKRDLFDRIRRSQKTIKSFKIVLDKEYEILFSERHIISLKQMIEESKNYVLPVENKKDNVIESTENNNVTSSTTGGSLEALLQSILEGKNHNSNSHLDSYQRDQNRNVELYNNSLITPPEVILMIGDRVVSQYEFKQRLLQKKQAKRLWYYHGREEPEMDIWNAFSFTQSSNLMGNIHSTKYRNWRTSGLTKLIYIIPE